MIKRISLPCLSVICMLVSGAALGAQVLYKSTMPDGRIIYADKPAPGAAKVEEQKPDTSKAGIQTIQPGDKATLKKMERERLKGDRADERLRAAEKALRDAEEALAKSQEPLPGERTGTAGSESRLNQAHWKRQQKLKNDVERARRNLERVRAQSQ